MEKSLTGKVALVTGSSKSIGRAIAIGLAEAGAEVAVIYKTDTAGAEKTCRTIAEAGGTAKPFPADIGSKAEFERVIDEVCDHFGRLEILVNNAARTRFGPIDEVTEDDFDDVVNTILRGPFFGSIAAAKRMNEAGGGSIINISSIAVRGIMFFHGAYTVAKGGLEAMTQQLALELAPRVRVNVIAPHATSNDRNRAYDESFDERWAAVTPAGRVGIPEDYIGPAVFLAGDAAAMVTGQIIYVDGGWSLQGHAPEQGDFDYSADRQRG
jgi:NAD(P)-dependent dehydrogenase (short-subunit alcohol dehydrogenase family)